MCREMFGRRLLLIRIQLWSKPSSICVVMLLLLSLEPRLSTSTVFSKPDIGRHEFCSRNASQCGVPSRAILVVRSLSRRQGDASFAHCAMSCHLSRISYEQFAKCMPPNVTQIVTPWEKFKHFKIFAPTWHALLRSTRIVTHCTLSRVLPSLARQMRAMA